MSGENGHAEEGRLLHEGHRPLASPHRLQWIMAVAAASDSLLRTNRASLYVAVVVVRLADFDAAVDHEVWR
ncbi:MAG: hypothetical protein CMJ64_24030 [Planctomycetaceae bacterium]|nr:hypothetical protein [Planctomycetaceae bacterium]